MCRAVLINTLYEFDSYFTTIIFSDKDGKIIHSRNLDIIYPDLIRMITYQARFMRNEQYVYDAVILAGTVGIYIGFKVDAFSITENKRKTSYYFDSILVNLLK